MRLTRNCTRIFGAVLIAFGGAAFAQDGADREQVPEGSLQSGTSAEAVSPSENRHENLPPARSERGIPSELLAPDRDERSREGHREGVPDLRVRPQLRPGEPAPYWLPPQTKWKLGVYAYNTETGAVVTRVVRRGPAARAGLERGDRIVNVGGHQVGYVEDRLFPLGYELQQHAGERGDVQLLVQNVRNRELISLDVRLERERDFD